MLTAWLTLTACLSASASARTAANGRDALTVAPTCRVKGQAEGELTLNCGDTKSRGVVEHWHTPFGDLHPPGFSSDQDPVFLRHDGGLVLTNLSSLHEGLYHCLLRRPRGAALFLYDLRVPHKQGGGRSKREVRPEPEEEEGEGGVSEGQLAGAVAASVVLTFVIGFSAGALSRTHVLSCLGAITKKLTKTPQPSGTSDSVCGVAMTTLPPMYENQALQMDCSRDSNTADGDTVESTGSTTSFPPAKPKRSFRAKHHEEVQETAAYLEGCDSTREEETQEERLECDRIDPSGSSETKDEQSEEGEREDKEEADVESEKEEWTGPGEQEDRDRSKRQEEKMDKEEEEEDVSERTTEEDETDSSDRSSTDTEEEEEPGSKRQEETSQGSKDGDGNGGGAGAGDGEEPPSSTAPSRGRRSRVIRLYQYDEEGQRFYHLPTPGPEDPVPAPRLKVRSASLTRLNAIMAAASAGQLDGAQGETEETDGEVKEHFQMDI